MTTVIAAPDLRPPAPPTLSSARALAGFMSADEIRVGIPGFSSLAAAQQAELVSRAGAAARLSPRVESGKPQFERVDQPTVLAFLANRQMAQPNNVNLVGFEWLEAGLIIAGQLMTRPLPGDDQIPTAGDLDELARFCLLSYLRPPTPVLRVDPRQISLLFSVGVLPAPSRIELTEGKLRVDYDLAPRNEPIRVLVFNGLAIAFSGIEKLVALRRAGVNRALCLVSFGFGVDVVMAMQTVQWNVISRPRPPIIEDFANDEVACDVPIRAPVTLSSVRVESVSLA